MVEQPFRYYDQPEQQMPAEPTGGKVDLNEVGTVRQLMRDDPMPFGKRHAGIKMDLVPASYLHWFYTEVDSRSVAAVQVRDYVKRNLVALKKEHPDGIWTPKVTT